MFREVYFNPVQNLKPATGFNVAVYSINDKGASERTVLKVFTLKLAEKHIASIAAKVRYI